MGAGSSWLESTIVLFLSSSSIGITGFSKSQLVSLCCCLATPYSHKDFSTSLWHHLHYFVFSVLLESICWRGIVPSCTESLETLTFTCQSSFSSCWCGESGRNGEALCHKCFLLPATPVYDNLVGHLRCRHRSTTNFLLLELRF